VAVLPDDLRVARLDHLARSTPDLRHLIFTDIEPAYDQVPGQDPPFQPDGLMFWFTWKTLPGSYSALIFASRS
jgi:hypothetical protein